MPKDIHVFNGMAQFYQCFINNFTFIMAPIMKLFRKTKVFRWITKCQGTWEAIKQTTITKLWLATTNKG